MHHFQALLHAGQAGVHVVHVTLVFKHHEPLELDVAQCREHPRLVDRPSPDDRVFSCRVHILDVHGNRTLADPADRLDRVHMGPREVPDVDARRDARILIEYRGHVREGFVARAGSMVVDRDLDAGLVDEAIQERQRLALGSPVDVT